MDINRCSVVVTHSTRKRCRHVYLSTVLGFYTSDSVGKNIFGSGTIFDVINPLDIIFLMTRWANGIFTIGTA
eukprot:scaffold160681_cov67-Attheya_sp.AAC.1